MLLCGLEVQAEVRRLGAGVGATSLLRNNFSLILNVGLGNWYGWMIISFKDMEDELLTNKIRSCLIKWWRQYGRCSFGRQKQDLRKCDSFSR